jgi:drug/metabolite transporter (DMT)-like permease
MQPLTARAPTLSPDLRGVLAMCAAMAGFAVNDGLMKAAAETVPLLQAIAMRGVLTVAALVALGLATGGLRLPPPGRDRRLLALRTLAEIAATLTFLVALTRMPLATLSAVLQSLPLAVTLAAWALFGERVGWRRFTAIAVGFAGVLVVIRPGPEGFDRWVVLALVSVAFVVVRDLATRRFSAMLPTATVALAAAAGVALTGAAGMAATGGWVPVAAADLVRIGLASLCLVAGYVFVIAAMRTGSVALVSPFRYTALLWSILIGWLLFADWPDALTLAGAALVVGSGLYTLWRETQVSRGLTAPDHRRSQEVQGIRPRGAE